MKYAKLLSLSIGTFFVCSCSMFGAGQQTPATEVPSKPLSVPLGKNWQLVEEAPNLSGERLHFQTEQSLQPEGAKQAAPPGKLDVETPR